ncbi:MAG: hypothetical protein HOB37_14575 [Rhodospirillaceae bacterium]|jgi:hypothetical protein|nr:hypothetical protein [Rhodospirillaceae bacterium]MBT5299280.1 hypothetical protein [Rhodospirillaceae bacterium]MBT6609665.1 hypothetical protein [Rhodospirillaceae bacterium]MBT6884397.1 hypothetical protein [Rhodospirillaceae bacterium]MBT7247670.1 hypothetical protein [Rhodospirillaceae bacterium]
MKLKTVAEELTPPFVAAIMLDLIQDKNGATGPSPSDELVSLAPSREGFLGLETTLDSGNRWISASYWRSRKDYNAWIKAGQERVSTIFDDMDLSQACKFRVSEVNETLYPEKALKAGDRAIPKQSQPNLGHKVFNVFPAIAEFLGYEHVR